MTTTAASEGRTTFIDRIARWALDIDGDMYGDERERLHWYEGIATAAAIQWLAVPWAAAVTVWIYGRPAVVPLATVLVVMYVPCMLCQVYVQRRRVDTTPRTWSPKRITMALLTVLPYALFTIGVVHATSRDSATTSGTAVGALVGSALGMAWLAIKTIQRRRREAGALPDAD
jgi:hypothetical protein